MLLVSNEFVIKMIFVSSKMGCLTAEAVCWTYRRVDYIIFRLFNPFL